MGSGEQEEWLSLAARTVGRKSEEQGAEVGNVAAPSFPRSMLL